MQKTGNFFYFLLLLALAIGMQSCTHHPVDRTGFLPPVKIKIPPSVKKDSATVRFIRSSEKVINTLSDKMEYLAKNGKGLLNKKDNELSVMDKLNMAKLSMEFMAAGSSLASEMEKIQQYIDKKEKEGVSKNELKPYKSVEKAIEKRMNALNKKYKNLMN
jgi:hypothetical protein